MSKNSSHQNVKNKGGGKRENKKVSLFLYFFYFPPRVSTSKKKGEEAGKKWKKWKRETKLSVGTVLFSDTGDIEDNRREIE